MIKNLNPNDLSYTFFLLLFSFHLELYIKQEFLSQTVFAYEILSIEDFL